MNRENKSPKYTFCPSCGSNLFIPPELINKSYIQCLNCGKTFRNPLTTNNGIALTKSQRNWLIAIAVILVLWFIGNISDDSSSKDYSNSQYTVNTTTYVATSKSSFDEMFRYINDGDNQALSTLMAYGEVQTLSAGTKVNLVSSHFSYCVVRLKGSTRKFWIVTEHITKT